MCTNGHYGHLNKCTYIPINVPNFSRARRQDSARNQQWTLATCVSIASRILSENLPVLPHATLLRTRTHLRIATVTARNLIEANQPILEWPMDPEPEDED